MTPEREQEVGGSRQPRARVAAAVVFTRGIAILTVYRDGALQMRGD
jgi:hypothetical protein